MVAVKVAMQPLSHSLLIDISEPGARLGKMYALRESDGSCGMFSCALCVEIAGSSHLEVGLRYWG